MMYDPSLPSVPFLGSDPQARHSDWASGKKMPPARAASEGMAGARRASAKTRE